jgi:hypothetical protein
MRNIRQARRIMARRIMARRIMARRIMARRIMAYRPDRAAALPRTGSVLITRQVKTAASAQYGPP